MKSAISIILAFVVGSLATQAVAKNGTCTGTYPSYFQDPAFTDIGMWNNQVMINQPPSGWDGPVFELSDAFSSAEPESDYPWESIDPFADGLSQQQKTQLGEAYMQAVMGYIQEGNIDSGDINTDWTLCDNKVRSWFHIPYQTYEPLSGREFVHGLTREAPVTMTLADTYDLKTTMWAVGFYNPAAANSLSEVWTGAAAPNIPTEDFHFNEGSVIGKLLFTTATPEQYPFLENMPAWQANISAPEFCGCTPASGQGPCTFKEQTEQCPRTVGTVYLLQFDIAVRDARSPIGWAYGTFVADGQRLAGEKNPWDRIAALGLMWGNDTPPLNTGAAAYPVDPRQNGLKDGVIFWDVVDMLNEHTNAGHLGCNSRLNGPADNAQSSCLSCHQTASVPDRNNQSPAIMFQFSGLDPSSGQCMSEPTAKDWNIDQAYFETIDCSTPFISRTGMDGVNTYVIVPKPDYASGQKEWISTDFSLQLSISLTQWQEWHHDQANNQLTQGKRVFDGHLPAR